MKEEKLREKKKIRTEEPLLDILEKTIVVPKVKPQTKQKPKPEPKPKVKPQPKPKPSPKPRPKLMIQHKLKKVKAKPLPKIKVKQQPKQQPVKKKPRKSVQKGRITSLFEQLEAIHKQVLAERKVAEKKAHFLKH